MNWVPNHPLRGDIPCRCQGPENGNPSGLSFCRVAVSCPARPPSPSNRFQDQVPLHFTRGSPIVDLCKAHGLHGSNGEPFHHEQREGKKRRVKERRIAEGPPGR